MIFPSPARRPALAVGLWIALAATVALGQPATPDQSGREDDYNQWKLSLGSGVATDPATFSAPQGFRVELVRSAAPDEGSWIALAFDPRGRAIVSREDKGLLRLTWNEPPAGKSPKFQVSVESINDTLLECRGLLWAHGALYANANNSKGLYRLRDTNGDDSLDEVQLLRATDGGVGHGRNDLALGPDGLIYSIHGDDVRLPVDFDPSRSPLRNFGDWRLFPCTWDQNLFNAAMVLPGGHLVRTDKDGQRWELVAGGLRNPYGLDFNAAGELFTFDADMEWDVGMPWYRPTRVLHLVSAADYGWRHGTGPWPAWYPDSLPTVADVGLSSPTAVRFGTGTKFPPDYQQALFLADWAYGRILAVTLREQGAGYAATVRPFVSGRPLNVTDLEVGPDGALYFLTGGRRTQSGLYRIRYVGREAANPVPAQPPAAPADASAPAAARAEAAAARKLRRELEVWHNQREPRAVEQAWPHLDSADVWLRHAARVAVENQPLGEWLERAWLERRPRAQATALLMVARVGPRETRDRLLAEWAGMAWADVPLDVQLIGLRALQLALARHDGRPTPDTLVRLRSIIEPLYPHRAAEFNYLASELLVWLESPTVVSRTLTLLAAARSQEEKLRYLYVLRLARGPWTIDQRRTYFEDLRQAREFYGAHLLPRIVAWIKTDAEAGLTPGERTALADLLAEPAAPADATAPPIARPHVRNWSLQDLVGSLEWNAAERNLERGKALYAAALCGKCHRLAGTGSPVGPDLTDVSRRFGRREILLSILYPSQVIDEKYQAVSITTHDGRVIVGQRLGATDEFVVVAPNPLAPDQVTRVGRADIESLAPSHVSPMPVGLLNTLSKAEILDLLAYLESARGASP